MARESKSLGQKELADACRLKPSQISGLERGSIKRIPSAQAAVKMARRLGIEPLVLLELGRPDFSVWRKAFRAEEKSS